MPLVWQVSCSAKGVERDMRGIKDTQGDAHQQEVENEKLI